MEERREELRKREGRDGREQERAGLFSGLRNRFLFSFLLKHSLSNVSFLQPVSTTLLMQVQCIQQHFSC